jgi:hypothetical protein
MSESQESELDRKIPTDPGALPAGGTAPRTTPQDEMPGRRRPSVAFGFSDADISRLRRLLIDLHALDALDEAAQTAAIAEIRSLTSDQLRLLLHLFDYEEPEQILSARQIGIRKLAISYLISIPLAVWFVRTLITPRIGVGSACEALVLACFPAGFVWYCWHNIHAHVHLSRIRRQIFRPDAGTWPRDGVVVTRALRELRDVSLIPILAQGLRCYWLQQQIGPGGALRSLFSLLGPEHTGLLDNTTCQILYSKSSTPIMSTGDTGSRLQCWTQRPESAIGGCCRRHASLPGCEDTATRAGR